jgi:hypothetical protein
LYPTPATAAKPRLDRPISSTSAARYGTCVGASGAERQDTTTRSSAGSGRGRSRMPRTSVKIIVAPAMPIASVSTAEA